MFSLVHVGSGCHKLIFRNMADVFKLYSSGSGGRNLTARGEFLTKSVRLRNDMIDSKSGWSQTISKSLEKDRGDVSYGMEVPNVVEPAITLKVPAQAKMFRGMVIPEKPIPPGPDDCCMSGCAICVYDLYITSLDTYRDALKSIRSALKSQDIPTAQWPDELQEAKLDNKTIPSRQDPDSELDVSLSAFAELEKSLRLKKKGKPNQQ